MTERQEKVSELVRHIVSEFIAQESNRTALITVTRVSVSPDLSRATAYITVLPEEKERNALFFLKRRGTDIRSQLAKNSHLKQLPFIEFEIDRGEKHRQHIDKLLRE